MEGVLCFELFTEKENERGEQLTEDLIKNSSLYPVMSGIRGFEGPIILVCVAIVVGVLFAAGVIPVEPPTRKQPPPPAPTVMKVNVTLSYLPIAVVYDPPGDKSYQTIEQAKKIDLEFGNITSVKYNQEYKAGFDKVFSIGYDLAVKGQREEALVLEWITSTTYSSVTESEDIVRDGLGNGTTIWGFRSPVLEVNLDTKEYKIAHIDGIDPLASWELKKAAEDPSYLNILKRSGPPHLTLEDVEEIKKLDPFINNPCDIPPSATEWRKHSATPGAPMLWEEHTAEGTLESSSFETMVKLKIIEGLEGFFEKEDSLELSIVGYDHHYKENISVVTAQVLSSKERFSFAKSQHKTFGTFMFRYLCPEEKGDVLIEGKARHLNGTALANTELELRSKNSTTIKTITGPQGEFSFVDIKPSDYEIRAVQFLNETSPIDLSVSETGPRQINIEAIFARFPISAGAISVEVTCQGKILSGVNVKIVGPEFSISLLTSRQLDVSASGKTDVNGLFHTKLRLIPAISYVLDIEKEGLQEIHGPVSVEKSLRKILDYDLCQ